MAPARIRPRNRHDSGVDLAYSTMDLPSLPNITSIAVCSCSQLQTRPSSASWITTVAQDWEAIVAKRATMPVVLTVAAAIGLSACASKTETVSTAPPPPPAYTPPPPPEPYVAPPAPTRKYVSKRRQARKERRHARRHARRTTPASASPTNVYGQPNQTYGIPGAGQASPSPTAPPSR